MMSRVPSTSVHQALNILLIASLAALCSVYLQLQAQYRELQLSCLQAKTSGSNSQQFTPSCAIACSDFCQNLARTEPKQTQSSSELSGVFTHNLNHAETDVGQGKSKLETIFPSYPAVFKTSDDLELELDRVTSEISLEGDKFYFAPSSSSSSLSLVFEKDPDLLLRSSKFKMTSAPELDDDQLDRESVGINDNLFYSKASSLVPTEDSFHTQVNIYRQKFSVQTLHDESHSLSSTKHLDEDLEVDIQNHFSFSTAYPFVETISHGMSSEAATARKIPFHQSSMLKHQDLDSTGHATDTEQGDKMLITENTFVTQDSCETELCPSQHRTNSDTYWYNDELYDGEYDEYDEIEDDPYTDYEIPQQKLFGHSVSAPSSNEQLPQREADPTDLDVGLLGSHGTSMSCETVDQSEVCHFQNLCFSTQERDFVFLVGDESSVVHSSLAGTLGQSQHFTLNLSAVPDHNAHSYQLVFLPAESLRLLSVSVVKDKNFILSRFKPDNLMHVLHDDLLPLVHTLSHHKLWEHHGKANVRLVMADSFDPGKNVHLYSSIFSLSPIWLFNPNEWTDLICFQDSFSGLSTATIWYQYGFFEPQGSVQKDVSQLIETVRKAAQLIASAMPAPCLFCKGDYLVLLSRKENRLILNEGELVLGLVQTVKMKVLSVSEETHSIAEIISIVKNSKGLLGMHGSLLVFGIFLPPSSVFIELFPYGVNPSKYTPFKTLCDLPNSGIVYKSWSNRYRSKTVGHPERPAQLGGIHHLTPDRQTEILEQTEVPDHLCCEDPSWLYHIYQDTYVDVDAVVAMTTLALTPASSLKFVQNINKFSGPTQQKLSNAEKLIVGSKIDNLSTKVQTESHQKHKQNFRHLVLQPSRVQHLSCQLTRNSGETEGDLHANSPVFLLTWSQPWNLKFLVFSKLNYEIVYQTDGAAFGVKRLASSEDLQYFIRPDTFNTQYFVWVRAVLDDNIVGPYQFIRCQTQGR